MRFSLILFLFAGAARTQQDLPGDDPKAFLLELRHKVMQTVDRLPKYLCTETVDRSTFQPQSSVAGLSCDALATRREKAEWKLRRHTSDRLRLDVAISGSNEMYSWIGEDRFKDRKLADLVGSGATSTGAFSGFLASLFGTNAANFTYNGDVKQGGRSLVEFGFRVPQEKSTYRFGTKLHNALVGYHGTFLVDSTTFDLVGLTVRDDDLPSELHVCESTTTLTYGTIHIGNSEFLIPASALWQVVNDDGTEFDSHLEFSTCHEFLGKSTVRFDEQPGSILEVSPSGSAEDLVFPPDLSFSVTLTSPIDTQSAAAGDLFKARLTSAIKTANSMTLVPKGAATTGRIVHIERIYESKSSSLLLAIKLEAVEVNGQMRPFNARLESIVRRRQRPLDAAVLRQDLGSFDQMFDPNDAAVGIIRLQDVTSDYVIEPGFALAGRTK